MDEKSEEEARQLLRVLGLAGTWDILHFLFENGTGSYLDFRQSMNTHTPNTRLNALIEYNLIVHHQVRNPRREWYEITEKGEGDLRTLFENTGSEGLKNYRLI